MKTILTTPGSRLRTAAAAAIALSFVALTGCSPAATGAAGGGSETLTGTWIKSEDSPAYTAMTVDGDSVVIFRPTCSGREAISNEPLVLSEDHNRLTNVDGKQYTLVWTDDRTQFEWNDNSFVRIDSELGQNAVARWELKCDGADWESVVGA